MGKQKEKKLNPPRLRLKYSKSTDSAPQKSRNRKNKESKINKSTKKEQKNRANSNPNKFEKFFTRSRARSHSEEYYFLNSEQWINIFIYPLFVMDDCLQC